MLLSSVVLISGVGLWIGDLISGAWVAVLAGLVGLLKDALTLTIRWFSSPGARLAENSVALPLLENLELTDDYRCNGYEIVKVPNFVHEYVVRSPDVDSFLRTTEVTLKESQELLKPITEKLRANSAILEVALRSQYGQSWRSVPPQRFVNEAKTCLGQDLFLNKNPIQIYRSGYFHSFLTNELVTRTMESLGPYPVTLFEGYKHFPKYPNGQVLKRVSESRMGNHIGISTLVHTRDNQLVLWRQSGKAQQSRYLLVPTGSGSCDWADWTSLPDPKRLKDLVTRAMEREFREESHPVKAVLQDVQMRTEILGFFRWIRRGGQPEFVGLSKAMVDSFTLQPNQAEVDAPESRRLVYPASTLDELSNSIEQLLAETQLSVPLWAILTCLNEAMQSQDERQKLGKVLAIE